ncbi:hypothetical protein SAMN04487948_1505 [Halogranum amylolyticum]|uniref:Uncharacterized protein n=1 Tax=Halogranum amylolyticum TaxID=660520 RepID=A0A1H8WWN9_9EURY|nr:hypothetical protein SAMN04487948_1505 [Halogranum amylolyticum]
MDADRYSLRSILTGGTGPNDPRSVRTRLQQWILYWGGRVSIAFLLLVGVFLVLLLASAVRPLDLRLLLRNTNTVQSLFTTLLSGSILLVSIVVTITSIVLSHEITDIDNERERIDAAIDYRTQIEGSIARDVSPARPAEFLRIILVLIDRQAEGLARIAAESDDDTFREEADAFVAQVADVVERTNAQLANARFGSFKILLAGLNYDYSWQLHTARRFKQRYSRQMTNDQLAAVDDLVETLKVFAVGREYFTSLYYKQEFARLSSHLLYVTLPTVVYTSYILLALDAKMFPDVSVLGISPLLLVVSFSYAVALAPYVLLTSYVLRAMAVTLRTLAAGPFVLRDQTLPDPVDWDQNSVAADWTGPTSAENDDDD